VCCYGIKSVVRWARILLKAEDLPIGSLSAGCMIGLREIGEGVGKEREREGWRDGKENESWGGESRRGEERRAGGKSKSASGGGDLDLGYVSFRLV
jgi:hypothetical protein